MNHSYFKYGSEEVDYLKSMCKKMAVLIDRIGPYQRRVTPDVFVALCRSIIGQQISVKAADTVSGRFTDVVGEMTPENILRRRPTTLQKCGMSMKKVEYIRGVAKAAQSGEVDFTNLKNLDDTEITNQLTALNGIGVWTVEMLLIFSLQRPDVISFGDLAIRNSLMKLHGHRKLTKELYGLYKKRYSPYGSTASLYLWALASE
jgi:3-methyladenine DNA glycosylase/8-oxoguanine DNA glycosylase